MGIILRKCWRWLQANLSEKSHYYCDKYVNIRALMALFSGVSQGKEPRLCGQNLSFSRDPPFCRGRGAFPTIASWSVLERFARLCDARLDRLRVDAHSALTTAGQVFTVSLWLRAFRRAADRTA